MPLQPRPPLGSWSQGSGEPGSVVEERRDEEVWPCEEGSVYKGSRKRNLASRSVETLDWSGATSITTSLGARPDFHNGLPDIGCCVEFQRAEQWGAREVAET